MSIRLKFEEPLRPEIGQLCNDCTDGNGGPVIFGEYKDHLCRRALEANCRNCGANVALTQAFRCENCGQLPDRSSVRMTFDFRQIVTVEKESKSFVVSKIEVREGVNWSRPTILTRFWNAARGLLFPAAR